MVLESAMTHGRTRRPERVDRTVVGLILALSCGAWLNRFIQDDAFISFRYARNLVEGHGLTFNPGERVEGYTNFAWTLLMALGIRLGAEPVAWSYLLGLTFFAASLAVTYRFAAGLSGSRSVALAAVVLLGTNFTFSAYATGGLETQMQAFLVTAALWLSWKATESTHLSLWQLVVTSCTYGLAAMTRLDSAVLLALPGIVTLIAIVRRHGSGSPVLRLLALCIPALIMGGVWGLWKLSYYGQVLPNTFYAKVASTTSLMRGGHYVYRFLASYWLLPLVSIALIARPRRVWSFLWPSGPRWAFMLMASGLLWCAYVAYVGGDFMEFRLMVPVLPLSMTLFAWGLASVVEQAQARQAVLVVVVLGSVLHGATFWGVRGIESVRNLEIHMEPTGGDWDEIGRALGDHFPEDSDVRIAVAAAGVIPFYARLPSVDMRGLVDPWVARNGIIVSTVPGHQRMSPLGYLVERGVNLVIGHPQVVPRTERLAVRVDLESLAEYGLVDASAGAMPRDARVIAIPIAGDRNLLAIYLVTHPAIDDAIAAEGWLVVPLGNQGGTPG